MGLLGMLTAHAQQQEDIDKERARKFDSLVNYADSAGIMSKDQAKVLNVDQLEGKIQGFMAKRQMDEEEATSRLAGNLFPLLQPHVPPPELPQGPSGSPYTQASGSGLADMLNFTDTSDTGAPMNINAALLQAMSKTGATDPHTAGILLNRFLPSLLSEGTGGVNFTEDPISHMRFAALGKQLMPSGQNEQALAGSGPIISPDGQFFRSGRNSWTHIKDTGAPAGSRFVNLNGVTALMTPDGRVMNWKMDNPMADLMRNYFNPGGTTTAPPPNTDPNKAPPVASTEQARFDGQQKRWAIFDKKTKKFLRYAD